MASQYVAALPSVADLSMPPPALRREVTNCFSQPNSIDDSSTEQDSDSDMDDTEEKTAQDQAEEVKEEQEEKGKEGFATLAKWDERTFEQVCVLPNGTWVTYTRDSLYLPQKQYDQAREEAKNSGRDLAEVVEAYRKKLPNRKKTTCKVVGFDAEKDSMRVESIPLSGARASAVFPNQTHSWDIKRGWVGAPKFYVINPEHHPENKKKRKAA